MNVSTFPDKGETVLSSTYDMSPGGKGANQSLAAARGGAKTALVGCVGDDTMGIRILNNVRRNEVMTSGVSTSESYPTGVAMVMREKDGDNRIIVVSGANIETRADQVPDEILTPGNIVLLQMEVPIRENIELMERAKEGGARVIVNIAPAVSLSSKLLSLADYVIVNQLEAAQIMKTLNVPNPDNQKKVLAALAQEYKNHIIMTQGPDGSILATPEAKLWYVPAMKLDHIIDTTGAGDCYCGTFAAGLHNGLGVLEAMRRATIAASLSCLKKGTQDSYPYSGDVDEYLVSFAQAEEVKA